MVRSEQESPVPEIGTPGLMWRGLETGPWGPYTGTKLETAETAKGNLPVPRLSSTLLVGGPRETWPMVGLGPHLATERARLETPHLPVRAPGIYPDSCTLGSVRGRQPAVSPTAELTSSTRSFTPACGGSFERETWPLHVVWKERRGPDSHTPVTHWSVRAPRLVWVRVGHRSLTRSTRGARVGTLPGQNPDQPPPRVGATAARR